jgi:hypothetical protein
MKEKYNRLVAYMLARMGEASTIQGVAAVTTLVGGYAIAPSHLAGIAAIASTISALLKILLPDSLTKGAL